MRQQPGHKFHYLITDHVTERDIDSVKSIVKEAEKELNLDAYNQFLRDLRYMLRSRFGEKPAITAAWFDLCMSLKCDNIGRYRGAYYYNIMQLISKPNYNGIKTLFQESSQILTDVYQKELAEDICKRLSKLKKPRTQTDSTSLMSFIIDFFKPIDPDYYVIIRRRFDKIFDKEEKKKEARKEEIQKEAERLILEQKLELEREVLRNNIELSRVKELENRVLTAVNGLHDSANQANSLVDLDEPSPLDIQLSLEWCDSSSSESTQARMLSARIAELAWIRYLKLYNYEVFDIAVAQIDGSTADWKLYDIRIKSSFSKELFIDVKNSRRSDKNPQNYTSHCVPKFKEYRASIKSDKRQDADILIGGALSDWQPLEDLKIDPNSVQILGVTSKKSIKKITSEFEISPLQFTIDIDQVGKILLPPWIFDFPRIAYEKLEQLQRSYVVPNDKELEKNRNLLFLDVAFARSAKLYKNFDLTPSNFKFVNSLAARRFKYGIRLPFIFLTILEHFVTCLQSKGELTFDVSFISSFLTSSNTGNFTTPLLTCDPTRSIFGLLNALKLLWSNRNEDLENVEQFKLVNLNILKGKSETTSFSGWFSVLAYCGGWIEEPKKRPCAKTPLILGECALCERGFLICNDCGFCCKSCKESYSGSS